VTFEEPKDEAKIKRALIKEEHKRHQILHGNITQAIIIICFPLAVYALFNSFYGLLDSIMAASIKNAAAASGAINISNIMVISQIKSMISAFGAGIAGGGAVLVSRYYGAANLPEAKKTASNMILVSLITSLLILILLVPLASIILKIAQVPQITDSVILYFRLILVELIFVSINNIFIGLEKIKGNSKKIFILNIAVLIIKLVLNLIFVYAIRVDSIIYLEIATITGQAFLLVYGCVVMLSKKNILQITIKNMQPQKKYIIPILRLSIPIFLGKFVMSLGKTTVNALCGSYYSEATNGLIVGALGVSNNLSGLVTNTTNVFEEGESTIVSQNIGNKNLDRTIRTFIRTLIIVAIISLIGYISVRFIFLDQLTSLFSIGKNDSNMMSTYIKEIFVFDSLSIPSLGLTSALLGLLYGYGKTFLSSILNFSRVGIRIISLIVCHSIGLNYKAAGISMGISNILISIMALGFLIYFLVNLKKNGYNGLRLTKKQGEN
ncbi:MAG: oligosaccharide flippase family protein, partial [Acholeplasmatales bacterium]|nr:oligosaccharide flippase family protein [Acholeplasmatales bacterium]